MLQLLDKYIWKLVDSPTRTASHYKRLILFNMIVDTTVNFMHFWPNTIIFKGNEDIVIDHQELKVEILAQ